MDRRELENILRSRTTDGKCPFCGENNWLAVEKDHEVGIPVPGAGEVRALALACFRCGFLRIHAKDVLRGDTKPRATKDH